MRLRLWTVTFLAGPSKKETNWDWEVEFNLLYKLSSEMWGYDLKHELQTVKYETRGREGGREGGRRLWRNWNKGELGLHRAP